MALGRLGSGSETLRRLFPSIGISVALAAAVALVIWMQRGGEGEEGESDISGVEGKICVMPIGDVPEEDVAFACDVLAAHIGRETIVYEPLPLQESYYYPERDQYSAAGFLAYVEANAPAEVYRAVGLTAADVTIPDLNFLFGMGRCPGKSAVLSTYRLDYYGESGDRRRVRFAKLLVHELGHTYGLFHCRQPRCNMKFANDYATLDYSRLSFCERCEERMCRVGVIDARERRAAIEGVVKEYGLWTEAGGLEGMTPPPPPANLSPEVLDVFH
jgi:archaemetzincin